MQTVKAGDRVQVRYVKRLQDGSVVSSREPLELTVGIDHPRLPGLGTALVGLAPGQAATLTVPPERAYGLADPARVHRWSRRRFPTQARLRPGKLVRFSAGGGRRRVVRIVEVKGQVVVVDANHRWAGQTLELEVQLVAIHEPGPGPQAPPRARAVAFDVDAASLAALREGLPGWAIDTIDGASAASLSGAWDPCAADLLVVGAAGDPTEALGLCRFLALCSSHPADCRQGLAESPVPRGGVPGQAPRSDAPLLVLVPSGQPTLVGAALEAGAASCLTLPVHPKEVAGMLANARAGNRPGRHTLDLEQAQQENRWQDEGGEA
jgi:peptidylprolyl isomerase